MVSFLESIRRREPDETCPKIDRIQSVLRDTADEMESLRKANAKLRELLHEAIEEIEYLNDEFQSAPRRVGGE